MSKRISHSAAAHMAIHSLKSLGIRIEEGRNSPSHCLNWAEGAIYRNQDKYGWKMFVIGNSDTSPIGKCVQYVRNKRWRVFESFDLTIDDVTPYFFDRFSLPPEPLNVEPIWNQIRAKNERKRNRNQKRTKFEP